MHITARSKHTGKTCTRKDRASENFFDLRETETSGSVESVGARWVKGAVQAVTA